VIDTPLAVSLKQIIRTVPDFPEKGILFRDITPLLADATLLKQTLEALAEPYRQQPIDYIVGIESRGFLFGIPLAYLLGTGFIPIRKKGKLPATTLAAEYALEYGTNTIEVHADAVSQGKRVVIVDDLLATGGTAVASVNLMQQLGAIVVGLAFAIELTGLGGREQLSGYPITTLVQYG